MCSKWVWGGIVGRTPPPLAGMSLAPGHRVRPDPRRQAEPKASGRTQGVWANPRRLGEPKASGRTQGFEFEWTGVIKASPVVNVYRGYTRDVATALRAPTGHACSAPQRVRRKEPQGIPRFARSRPAEERPDLSTCRPKARGGLAEGGREPTTSPLADHPFALGGLSVLPLANRPLGIEFAPFVNLRLGEISPARRDV